MCVLASAVDIFSSHLIIVLKTVLQLSWLERYTDNVEVGSSNLPGTTLSDLLGGLAQLARAPALHAGGQGFESLILHEKKYIDILG